MLFTQSNLIQCGNNPKNCPFPGRTCVPPNTWCLGPTRVHKPNGVALTRGRLRRQSRGASAHPRQSTGFWLLVRPPLRSACVVLEENAVRTETSFNFERGNSPNPTKRHISFSPRPTSCLLSQRVPKLTEVAGHTGAASGVDMAAPSHRRHRPILTKMGDSGLCLDRLSRFVEFTLLSRC